VSYFRLRQICLVTADLPRAIADMQTIFGVTLAFQDPHLVKYGLANALFPFGLSFVEIVAPIQPDTAAGRFLERSGGVGGYMAIFNCDDPERRGEHARSLGVPIVNTMDHDDFFGVQLHPRDCRATMIEFDRTEGGEDIRGNYYPAGGKAWTAAIKTDVTQRLAEMVLESPQPADLGRHWSGILEKPFRPEGEGGVIDVDMTSIRFSKTDGDRETLRALVIHADDPEAMLQRARNAGYPVSDGAIEFCGVAFEVRQA
jgi:catechol 2,3-dioxygenase-like lactoylglutathione lyase family enzyme